MEYIYHRIGTFPFVIKGFVAPSPVQSDRSFYKPVSVFRGQTVISAGNVITESVAYSRIYKTAGLVFSDHIVKLSRLLNGLICHRSIKPYQAQISVFCEYLLQLRLDLFLKADAVILFIVIGEIPIVTPAANIASVLVKTFTLVSASVRLVPIKTLRIVKSELYTVLAARLGKLSDYISFKRRGINGIVAVNV